MGVEVLNPEIPKKAFEDKGIVLDLMLRLADGSLVDVEMQVDRRPAFRKRALYYWSRMFSSQLVRGEVYGALRPTVLVVFLNYRELEAKRLHSVFRVLEASDHQLFCDELEIHLVESCPSWAR